MAQAKDNLLRRLDCVGNTVAMGARVRIIEIPDWLVHDLPADEAGVLLALRGTDRTIVKIDEHGYVWFGNSAGSLWFCVQPSDVLVLAAPGEPSN